MEEPDRDAGPLIPMRAIDPVDLGGAVSGGCWGQAREMFTAGLQPSAVRDETDCRRNGDIERLIGADRRAPELVLGDIRGQLGADRMGERGLDALVGKFGKQE